MSWPRFQLTTEEAKFSTKYGDPRVNQQQVIRRMYYAELNLSPSLRVDATQFSIARRSRVLGLTFAGDIPNFELEITDTNGEQFTGGPVHVPHLAGGYYPHPRAAVYPAQATSGEVTYAPNPSQGPYVFEPNLQVAANQTVVLRATPADSTDGTRTFKLGVVLHVVEFPGAA